MFEQWRLRGDASGTIAKLKSLGIEPVLLTGDKQDAADRVSKARGQVLQQIGRQCYLL